MALTQISTNGIKDATIATADIADDAVNADKLANSINTEIAANTAKTTNATHTGEVTGATALTIADNVVDEANLKISNAGSDGQALTKQSGNTGGLTWATISAGISDIVSDTSPQLGGDLDTNSFEISLDDAHSVKFGDGNDLKIYHTSGDNRIENHGANLYLRTGTSGDETSAVFVNNGAVKLYYDNSLKFETSSSGIRIPVDSGKLEFGADQDTQLIHDGSDFFIQNKTGDLFIACNVDDDDGGNIYIRPKNGENSVSCIHDGAVELYYDNGKKLQTASHGLNIYNTATTSCLVQIGTSQGTPGFVAGGGTTELGFQDSQQHWTIRGVKDGSAELYYDNSKKFETNADGTRFYGRAYFDDNYKIEMGAAADLKIWHDATYNRIQSDNSKSLVIEADGAIAYFRAKIDEESVRCNPDGAVEIFYDNSKKFETTSGGISVTGQIALTDAVKFVDHSSSTTGMAIFGSDNDMRIWHNGTNGEIHNGTGELLIRGDTIKIQDAAGTHNYLKGFTGAQVELFHDNNKKLETTSDGVRLGDSVKLVLGADGDAKLYETGSKLWLDVFNNHDFGIAVGAGNEHAAAFNANGSVDLYYDNAKKFETISTGVNITGGIRVGGNNAANELDDYEEGTWTPNFVGHSTNGSGTYSSVGAWYVKVGRQVTVGGYGSWTAHTGSGNMRINNLPFSRKSGDGYAQAGAVLTTNWNYNAGEQAVCYAESGSELLFMQVYDDESWEGMQLDTNAACMFGLSYWTDS